MRTMTTRDLLWVWERGCRQHPVDRALTILMAGYPESTWEELVSLSIGQRDSRLLSVRERTFGTHLESHCECRHCQERLEFSVDSTALRDVGAPMRSLPEYSFVHDEIEVCFRLPNSWDLAAIATLSDPLEARSLLVERCVLQVTRQGAVLPAGDLSEEVVQELGSQLAEQDPQSEVVLDLACPTCGRNNSVLFDIATYLWLEIDACAKRLLREVHTLARAYAWRESDILELTPVRRQFYLAMVH